MSILKKRMKIKVGYPKRDGFIAIEGIFNDVEKITIKNGDMRVIWHDKQFGEKYSDIIRNIDDKIIFIEI